MQYQSPTTPPAAPMAHASLVLVCGAGRVPIVTAGPPEEPGETRLSLEALGVGYGATVSLRGVLPILRAVVAELGAALDQAEGGVAR